MSDGLTAAHCSREVTEVEITLSLVKAALIFKGLDFSSIFADASQPSGHTQQLTKELFCQKIAELGAKRVSPEMIRRLANYLALNQRDRGVIHLKLWLLHLRRVGAAFQVVDIEMLPIICQKILLRKAYFRSLVEEISQLKDR